MNVPKGELVVGQMELHDLSSIAQVVPGCQYYP